jgi:hypothetical protein
MDFTNQFMFQRFYKFPKKMEKKDEIISKEIEIKDENEEFVKKWQFEQDELKKYLIMEEKNGNLNKMN